MRRIVVVGNGIAGLTAADTLRAHGFEGELTIIGDEPHAPYSRPALSKSALSEEGELSTHLLPEPEHGANEILGVAVTRLSLDDQELTLDDGRVVPFDGLVIATGVRPRKIREDAPFELTFRRLEDALELREKLSTQPRVVIIGAGVLGMEIASSCVVAGAQVTVVSRRTPMLASLGEHLATVFMTAAKKAGVQFVQPGAVDVELGAHGYIVELEDGTTLNADVVITAIGDRPNTEWLQDSGLISGGELQVDSRGRLRHNVVAAGDVAAIPHAIGHERVPLWTSAIEQAKVAAQALIFGSESPELNFQQYFWTDQFGLSLKACGVLPLTGEPEYVDGTPGANPSLLRWSHPDGTGTAVSINYRIPIPKLRALSRELSPTT